MPPQLCLSLLVHDLVLLRLPPQLSLQQLVHLVLLPPLGELSLRQLPLQLQFLPAFFAQMI